MHFVLRRKLHRTLLSTYFKQNSILLARPVEPDGVHSILICDYHCLCGLCRRGCPNGGVHLRGFPFKRCHQLSYKLRVLLCSILLWETKGRQEVGTSRGVRRNLPFVAIHNKGPSEWKAHTSNAHDNDIMQQVANITQQMTSS